MINQRILTAIALAAPLGVLGAQAEPSARTSLIEAEQAAASAVFQRGLQAGWEDLLAEDVVLVFEGAPLMAGRGRASQVLANQPLLARLRIQRLPLIVAISEDGLLGATSGASVITRMGQPPDSGASFGHYIVVWRRSGAGAPWRAVALLENGVLGATPFEKPAGFETGPIPLITGPARQMAEADLAFARLAADSGAHAAFGKYAASDATLPPGDGELTVGAAAIRARLANPARLQSVWAWHPVYAGASAAGDFGWTAGEATIRSSPAADASVYEGKYLTVWRREPDGAIKFILDSGNPR